MNLIKKLFCYDSLYSRIDLTRNPSYIIIAATAFIWSLLGDPTPRQYINRLIISGVFLILVRFTMVRLGASRLSTIILTLFSFVLLAGLSPRQLAEVGSFVALLLICVEFSKMRTKTAALGAGVAVGLLAVGEAKQATAMLVLFGLFLVTRLFWHALFEKISKIEIILFFVKVAAALVLSFGIHKIFENAYTFPWTKMGYIAMPHISLVVIILGVILAARGLWATLLLQTERSPKARGIRMYVVFFGLFVFLLTGWLKNHGANIFAADFLGKVHNAGFTAYSIQLAVFGWYALVLLMGAGIDRSLFRDTKIGSSVRKQLKSKA
jgi:hypothetical protein